MAFSVKCSGCGSSLAVVEALIGKTIRCKTCGAAVAVAAPTKGKPTAPTAAKPLPADVEAAELDLDAEPMDAIPLDDEGDAPPPKRPARQAADRPRDEDADDEPAPAKRSALPLVFGGLAALIAVAAIGGVVVYALNRDDGTAAATTPKPADDDEGLAPIADPKPIPGGPTLKPLGTPASPGGAPPAPEPGATRPTRAAPTPPKPAPTPPKPDAADDNPFNRGAKKPDPATLAKLKASTVYLEVDDGRGGGGTGTGFFTGDPGLIVTNAHVLQMKRPGSKEPAKVSAFVESGQAKQKLFEGPKVKVLAVDHEKDLAVLQIVNEKDLPPPLLVKASAGLNELDTLVVFGFPGGRRLSERNGNTRPPEVSVTVSTVSAFRNDDFGNRNSIQVQGGINHGSSGGPVVDAAGNVVGVAVRVDLNHNGQLTTLGEAVPSEYVTGLIAGRVGRVEFGQAYIKGDRVAVPVSVKCADPLGQLRAVGVGFWIGEKGGRPRPPGDKHDAQGGDVGYQEAALLYAKDKQVATGEIDFPLQTDGRAYWVQPFYSNKLVSQRYVAGNPITLASPPVDRTPGVVQPKYVVGTKRELAVVQTVQVTETFEVDGKEVQEPRTLIQSFTAEERVEKPKAAANFASLEYTFSSVSAKLKAAGEDKPLPKTVAEAVAGSKPTTVSVAVSRAGEPSAAVTVPASATDAAKKDALTRYGRQLSGVVRESLLKFAGKTANAGETWTVSRVHWLTVAPDDLLGERTGDPKRRTRQTQEELTVTYLGRRDRGGRAELVLKVDGTLRPIEGAPDGSVSGTVKGNLVVEDQTGAILEADWTRTFDLDTSDGGTRKRATGTEETTVSRGK